MTTEVMLDFIVRTGIPAGLGVVVVMYLMRTIIPDMQQTFRDEMTASRQTFKDALESEQRVHSQMMQQITEAVRDESAQTRAAIKSLDDSTKELSQTVFKIYGATHGPEKRSG